MKQISTKNLQYAYTHRKLKKQQRRSQNIVNINAAVRQSNDSLNYSKFIQLLYKHNVLINRPMLSYMAKHEYRSFSLLVASLTQK